MPHNTIKDRQKPPKHNMVALITPQKITCLPYLKAKETFSVILHFFCRFILCTALWASDVWHRIHAIIPHSLFWFTVKLHFFRIGPFLLQCKWNHEGHINTANDLKTSHNSKWFSLLGDSGWLAVAHMKMKTHLWFEKSFILTNGTEPHTLLASSGARGVKHLSTARHW